MANIVERIYKASIIAKQDVCNTGDLKEKQIYKQIIDLKMQIRRVCAYPFTQTLHKGATL